MDSPPARPPTNTTTHHTPLIHPSIPQVERAMQQIFSMKLLARDLEVRSTNERRPAPTKPTTGDRNMNEFVYEFVVVDTHKH